MPVRVRFRCEHCDELPDPATQLTLEGQLLDRTHGEFWDAHPGGWLIWTAGGALGSKLYACARHRTDLTAHVRRHYGAIRSIVWRSEPYPAASVAGAPRLAARSQRGAAPRTDRQQPSPARRPAGPDHERGDEPCPRDRARHPQLEEEMTHEVQHRVRDERDELLPA
jgi:hypothetical protein